MVLDAGLIGTIIVTGLAVGATIGGILKTRFVTKNECATKQKERHTEQKLQGFEMGAKIDTIAQKIDDIKKNRSEEQRILYKFIGKVEEYIRLKNEIK